jgi:hypothetical protein
VKSDQRHVRYWQMLSIKDFRSRSRQHRIKTAVGSAILIQRMRQLVSIIASWVLAYDFIDSIDPKRTQGTATSSPGSVTPRLDA